jgi:hypothetical protein
MSPIDYKAFCAKLNGEHVEPPTESDPQSATPAGDQPSTNVDGKSGLAVQLESVSGKALDKLNEIMGLPLNPETPQVAGLLRAQTAAAGVALTTQVRVDENQLRKQLPDRLPELLRLAAEVRAQMPPLEELQRRQTMRERLDQPGGENEPK